MMAALTLLCKYSYSQQWIFNTWYTRIVKLCSNPIGHSMHVCVHVYCVCMHVGVGGCSKKFCLGVGVFVNDRQTEMEKERDMRNTEKSSRFTENLVLINTWQCVAKYNWLPCENICIASNILLFVSLFCIWLHNGAHPSRMCYTHCYKTKQSIWTFFFWITAIILIVCCVSHYFCLHTGHKWAHQLHTLLE